MSRLFIGNLPGVGPAVKIMANDTDDPRTTPNTDWWKFRFNSETAEIGYVEEVWNSQLFDSGDYPGGTNYYPSGTSDFTCDYVVTKIQPGSYWLYQVQVNLGNMLPAAADFIHWVASDASDWIRLYGGVRRQYFSGGGSDYLYWFGRLGPDYQDPGVAFQVDRQGTYEDTGGGRFPSYVQWTKPSAGVVNNTLYPLTKQIQYLPLGSQDDGEIEFTIYRTDLPIDDSPYPAVVGTPAADKKIVRIDQSNAKIAKPGFHVDTATDDQLIIGHDKPPLLVARTGSFTLAAGAQQNIDVDLPITTKSLVDYQVNKTGADLYLPAYPDNDADELNIQYRIVGQQVQFKNPSSSVSFDVRFFVMAADELGTTTGSAKVLNADDGIIQLLRPGSAATPNSRDILLDSRATYLPMIAQGYVPNASFSSSGSYLGNRVYRVNLPAGDYKPFVLARSKNAILYNGSPTGEYFYSDFYGKQLSIYDYMSSSTFLAHVTDTYIDFYANIGRAEDVWRYETGYASSMVYSQFLGMRYYIFAVPNSL